MQQGGYFSSTDTIQSTYSSFTLGSVIFQGTNFLAQNNANFFWNNTSSYLGIGTNAPDSPLTVSGSTTIPPQIPGSQSSIHVVGPTAGGTLILADSFSNTDQQIMRRADGTAAAPSAVQSGDAIGQYVFYGYGATAYQNLGGAKIVATAAENFTDTTGAMTLGLYTRPTGTVAASTLRLLVDQTGGVTIGSLSTGGPVRSNTSGLLSNGATTLSSSDVTGVLPIANGGTNNSAAYTAGSVIFSNGTSLTQNNANFFWDNTNIRLGIGTTTPTTALQIVASVAGGIGTNITNSSASTSASLAYNLTNQNGATGSLALFANNFAAAFLSNATRVAGSNALWLVSDVNVANGGTDNIVFSPGGYNNITAQVTNAGMTSINYTDTGIAASNAGAPLSITSGQVITAGITNTSITGTTATAYGTTATTITTYTPAAGTYLCIFTMNITANSAAGNTLTVSFSYNGTQIAASVRQITPQNTAFGASFQFNNIDTNAIITTNGTASITTVAQSSAGTVTGSQYTFNAIRIA